MRGFAYIMAVVVAVGIMIGIASLPPTQASAPAVMTEAGTLVFDVPEMMCEFSCFPRVKETLESDRLVQAVELAAQQEEGTLDNRQVIVTYDAGFNVSNAIAALSKEGFGKSDVASDEQAASRR